MVAQENGVWVMTLLSVNAIDKSFGGLRALDNIYFSTEPGEIVGLMGANGAGKTTLFSIIAGHSKPSAGEIQFRGLVITGLRPNKICRLGIARTFQIVRPFAGMSVRENVETAIMFGSEAGKPSASIEGQAMDVLDEVGLSGQAGKLAGTLTLSDRKRLEVARALGTRPALLLLDEVMAGLTPTEIGEMIDTLREVKKERGLTIIIVEHVVRAMVELSNRIIVLHHGQLIAEGTPDEIANNAAVLEAYFGETPP